MSLDRLRSLIKTPPRIPELLFAAVLIWLFATGQGWSVLLADGDTGWHIRNGEQIIDTRSVPHCDPFSFGSAGHPWFSWEWLSDVLFAALFRIGGLEGRRGLLRNRPRRIGIGALPAHGLAIGGVCIALPLTLLAVGASSVHYLARPHVIGLLFFAVVAWIIDRDRVSPGSTDVESTPALPAVGQLPWQFSGRTGDARIVVRRDGSRLANSGTSARRLLAPGRDASWCCARRDLLQSVRLAFARPCDSTTWGRRGSRPPSKNFNLPAFGRRTCSSTKSCCSRDSLLCPG